MRSTGKVDANQLGLVKALRQIPGVSVSSTASIGKGFPDILVGFRGSNFLFELKDPDKPPSKRRLTPMEQEFFEHWSGHVALAETVDGVLADIGLVR